MKCKNCNKELPNGKRKFCSDKCANHNFYKEHKDKYIKNARDWESKNPKKARECHKKANDKYRENNRARFNKLILKQYYKNKSKWHCRSRVYKMLEAKNKKIELIKKCNKCGSENDLRLKFEEYPGKTEDIINAVNKKIYYLCGDCR